ncbi:hypothetical protein B0G73_13616 [Paraburkholderia sp. BL25I1N1]|nr:hypothetical protein B0G73_13616 [Paraburkholderia sp. BL25I1N1]
MAWCKRLVWSGMYEGENRQTRSEMPEAGLKSPIACGRISSDYNREGKRPLPQAGSRRKVPSQSSLGRLRRVVDQHPEVRIGADGTQVARMNPRGMPRAKQRKRKLCRTRTKSVAHLLRKYLAVLWFHRYHDTFFYFRSGDTRSARILAGRRLSHVCLGIVLSGQTRPRCQCLGSCIWHRAAYRHLFFGNDVCENRGQYSSVAK